MVYIAFAAFVFYQTLKNVRSVGGFDKGVDYVVAAIATFIFTLLFMVFAIWAMLALLPTKEVYENTPLVKIKLDDSDIPTYITVSGEPGERVYNYIYRDEDDTFTINTTPVAETKIKEGEVPSLTYIYDVIDMRSPVWSFIARWGFFLDDYLKIHEVRYFSVPLNSVRRDYELSMDDIFAAKEVRQGFFKEKEKK